MLLDKPFSILFARYQAAIFYKTGEIFSIRGKKTIKIKIKRKLLKTNFIE